MICMIQMRRCCHNTQYCLLTKYGRKYRYTDIDLLSISKCYPKMSILWDSLFCNVQICQNLNTGNQWPRSGRLFALSFYLCCLRSLLCPVLPLLRSPICLCLFLIHSLCCFFLQNALQRTVPFLWAYIFTWIYITSAGTDSKM